mgnify:CR=1 FL=1
MKKKVVVLLGHYLPGTKIGGPITSIKNIVDSLSKNIEFYIITSDRDFKETLPYPNIVSKKWLAMSNYSIFYVRRNIFSLIQIAKQLKELKADVIYLNPFFDPLFSISIVILSRLNLFGNSKIIVAPRGEMHLEALKFKAVKKKITLSFFKIFNIYKNVIWHATSKIEKELISAKMGVSLEKIKLARNISNTSEMTTLHPLNDQNDKAPMKVVYLARISKDKNIPFAFEVLSRVNALIQFDVYGPIEDLDIWRQCQIQIAALPSNIKVSYKGVVEKEEVKKILSTYDLFFMPTFAENYGHSIAESLSVGTPVLISDNTPWRNLVELGLGWDINLLEKERFVEVVEFFSILSDTDKYDLRVQRQEKTKSILEDPSILRENLNLFINIEKND